MAGRVHGRVQGGEVFILSRSRHRLRGAASPTAPEFQLAGDSERVAITCAALGVRADELELPVPLDRIAYRRALALLEARGIIENGPADARTDARSRRCRWTARGPSCSSTPTTSWSRSSR